MTANLFTAAQLAQLIASPKLTPEAARLRVKNFVGSHYVLTRERKESDGRGTLLFSEGDALTVAILSQMVDLGGLSKNAMAAAASRLQSWRFTDGDLANAPENPALWAMQLFRENGCTPLGASLHVSYQRNHADNVQCTAGLSHGEFGDVGEGAPLYPQSVPIASLLIPLDPIMLELATRIDRLDKAN